MMRTLKVFLRDDIDDDISNYLDGDLFIIDDNLTLSIGLKRFYGRDSKKNYKYIRTRINDAVGLTVSDEEESLYNELLYDLNNNDSKYFYDTFDYVLIDVDDVSLVCEVIKSNYSFFQNKKIILPNLFDMSYEDYELCRSFERKITFLLPNVQIMINVRGNSKPVDIKEYYDAYNKIKDTVRVIKALNLSQLENIMFVYDIVKSRIYKKEEVNEDACMSRDLTKVILGDSIVCGGFYNLFDTFLNLLGIECQKMKLINTEKAKPGHVRAYVYVDDEKYNIKGYFCFDPSIDSREDGNYINQYLCFLKTIEAMHEADQDSHLQIVDMPFLYLSHIKNVENNLLDEFSLSNFSLLGGVIKYYTLLENMKEDFVKLKFEGNRKKDLLDSYRKIYDSFNTKIDLEEFIRLLFNVRKVEYYLNPSVPFDEDAMKRSILSYQLLYEQSVLDALLTADTLEVNKTFITESKLVASLEIGEEMKKEIERVKITRRLRHLMKK